MIFRILGHDYHYETRNVVGLFFPGEKVDITDQPGTSLREITSSLAGNLCCASLVFDGVRDEERLIAPADETEETLCRALFVLLRRNTGISPPWGMLTGVRPVKQIAKGKALGRHR